MSGDRAVLLDSNGTELITLNPVGSLVWNAIDGWTDRASLVTRLGEQFPEIPTDQIVGDVEEFLDELRAAGLVLIDDAHG